MVNKARQQPTISPSAAAKEFQLDEELAIVYKAIANTQNGIIITDHTKPDEPIIYVNNAFETLTGYSRSEIIGKNCRFLQGDKSDQAAIRNLRQALKDETDVTVVLYNYRKDGLPFWNELTVSPIKDSTGRVTHFVGIQYDVTERVEYQYLLQTERDHLESRVKTRTEELEVLNAQLRSSNHELEEFAYVASHDLQEPLRKIQAFSNLLISEYQDKLSGDGEMYLDRIQNAAGRMRTLINDLLSYSRITRRSQHFERIPLRTIVDDVLVDMESVISDVNAHITIGELPEIEADSMQMRQLFQNLISNGLKFHASDTTPEIVISSETLGKKCRIRVQDNGIGIDPKYLDRIFTIFQRLHAKEVYAGTGIGLAVVRKIIEHHRGSITVESTPGNGATFIFTLPLNDER